GGRRCLLFPWRRIRSDGRPVGAEQQLEFIGTQQIGPFQWIGRRGRLDALGPCPGAGDLQLAGEAVVGTEGDGGKIVHELIEAGRHKALVGGRSSRLAASSWTPRFCVRNRSLDLQQNIRTPARKREKSGAAYDG